MKKILLLSFLLIAGSLSFAQHPDLLNTNWKITKIVNEFSFSPWLPPSMPYQQNTTFSTDSPQLTSSFFNVVSADITYDGQDRFTVSNKTCTLADYMGDNGEVNQFFGLLCSFFNTGDLFYQIVNNGSEKTLVVYSPIFEEVQFTAQNLAVKDSKLSQYIVAPNPVKNVLTVENTAGINAVSIFDVTGKLVYELKNESAKILKIDMRNYKTGNYFIKLNNEKTFKIIKE